MAELAVSAAPGDLAANRRVFSLAVSNKDFGRAVRAAQSLFKIHTADPWARFAFETMLKAALGLGALAAALALAFCALPYYAPLFYHDLGDKFPKGMRKYAPAGAIFLLSSLSFALGGVLALFLILPAAVAIFYSPWRVRIALAVAGTLAFTFFPAMADLEKLTGQPGEKGWALYRVWKGDAGADMDSELSRIFGDKDSKALFARALVARRNGEREKAKTFMKEASDLGGLDRGLILSQQASLEFVAGRTNEAAKLFEELTETKPGDWKAWYNLSVMRVSLLDLGGAENAKAKARQANPVELERIQAQSSDAGGDVYPIFENFPSSWIRESLAEAQVPETGWSNALWRGLGFPIAFTGPVVGLIIFGLLLAFAKATPSHRISTRCHSCGAIKCPRCHRMVKDPDLCSGCYALTHDSGLDADSRKSQRDEVLAWTLKVKNAHAAGNLLAPGWNAFVYNGGVAAPILGVIWAGAIGFMAARTLVVADPGAYEPLGFPLFAALIFLACHGAGFVWGKHR